MTFLQRLCVMALTLGILAGLSAPARAEGDDLPTAEALLKAAAPMLDDRPPSRMEVQVVHEELKTLPGHARYVTIQRNSLWLDGDRIDSRWSAASVTPEGETGVREGRTLWDGKTYMNRRMGIKDTSHDPRHARRLHMAWNTGAFADGDLTGENVLTTLAKAKEVRVTADKVADKPAHLLTTAIEHGELKVWLDVKAHHLLRIELTRATTGSLGQIQTSPNPADTWDLLEEKIVIDSFEYATVDKVTLPVAATYNRWTKYRDLGETEVSRKVRRSDVKWNPPFEEDGAFKLEP